MIALCAAFVLAGYTLVYAAVAKSGRFADAPWEGLRRDAYAGAETSSSTGGGGHGESTIDRIIGWGIRLASPFGGLL